MGGIHGCILLLYLINFWTSHNVGTFFCCGLEFHCSTLSQTKTCVTVFRMSTIESRVFRKHYSQLQTGLQSPSLIAGKLYSKMIIDWNVRNAVQMTNSTVLEKSTALLDAVEQAISCDPQCFHLFMEILDDDPTTYPLHTLLMSTYDKLRQSHSNSSSSLPLLPSSTPPHTIIPLPQRLRIKGPDDHFTTVKVVPGADKTPEDADQLSTLPLSILGTMGQPGDIKMQGEYSFIITAEKVH